VDEGVEELFNLTGPEDEEGYYLRVRLLKGDLEGYSSAIGLGRSIGGRRAFELRKGRVVDEHEEEVEGADAGWRVVTEFTPLADEGGDGPRGRLTELVASRGGDSYILSIAGAKADLKAFPSEVVLASLRLD
jgi:hypothetical protein